MSEVSRTLKGFERRARARSVGGRVAKFVINKTLNTQKSVEADWYKQEGDFFAFFDGGTGSRETVVLTVAAGDVHTIWTEKDEKQA